jgi:quercetin dioxygenase-like cupin family protein
LGVAPIAKRKHCTAPGFAAEGSLTSRFESVVSDANKPPTLDLASNPAARGPVDTLPGDDLNVTLLAWSGHEQTPEHVNRERDVLIVVISGSGTLEIDGQPHPLTPLQALVIEKGRRRRIHASADGIRYLSIHTARGGLRITHRTHP